MLVIRGEMMHALAASAHAGFVGRARSHLQRYFPEKCEAMGTRRLTQFIEYGIFRAREWDFTLEPDIIRYITIMMVFGHAFDRDENHAWARHILTSRAPPDPSQRMTRLDLAAQAMLAQHPGRVS